MYERTSLGRKKEKEITENYLWRTDSLGHPIYRQEPTRAVKNRQEPSSADERHFYAFLD